jgi:Na+-driven multidrug efflux pump
MDLAMGLDLFLQCLLALTLVPGFLRTAPNLAIAGDLARMAWPISLQQCLHRAGLVILFGVVAELGIQATAILNVLVTLLDVPSQIQTGLGIAVATLVGQALGRHEPVGAREWGWRASIIASAVTAPFGLAMLLAPAPVAGYFLREGGVVDLATLPMRLAGVGCVVQATATVLGFAFRGAGATKISAFVPFVSFWCFLLPLNFWAVHTPARGIVTVAAIQAVIVVIDAVILMALWSRMSWARVKVSGLDDH